MVKNIGLVQCPLGQCPLSADPAGLLVLQVAQPLLDVEEFVLLQGEPAAPGADDLFAGIV